jgi:hypothetical protein
MNAVGDRTNGVHDRMNALRDRMSAVETRVNTVETRMNAVRSRMNAVRSLMNAVQTRVDALRDRMIEMKHRINAMDHRKIDMNHANDAVCDLISMVLELVIEVSALLDALAPPHTHNQQPISLDIPLRGPRLTVPPKLRRLACRILGAEERGNQLSDGLPPSGVNEARSL